MHDTVQGAKYIALDNRGASGPTCSSTVMHSYTILLPHKGYMAHNLYESLSAGNYLQNIYPCIALH
jgi:hypothetical protein